MGPASKRLRVIVTRAREQLEPLARRIEELGLDVERCPLIELEPIGPEQVDVGGYDWVVVTSPFGARELLRRARGALPQVAAIGPGTAAALAEDGSWLELCHGDDPAAVAAELAAFAEK